MKLQRSKSTSFDKDLAEAVEEYVIHRVSKNDLKGYSAPKFKQPQNIAEYREEWLRSSGKK